ncbi:MAG: O-antigen ligase family protein [Thermodesulfobacteriota bacterium]|nr:O-antigen ligase family protein [Thermodesulfobacteriota bacterium]
MSSDYSIITHPVSQLFYYVVVSTIPYYQWRHMIPGGIPVDWILTFFLLIVVAIHLITTKRIPDSLNHNLNKWFLLFFVVNIISTLFSPYQDEAFSGIVTLVQGYIFISLSLVFITEKGFTTILPIVLCVSVGINALFSSLGYFFGIDYFNIWGGVQTYGATIGANNMSLMCVFVIPLFVYWIFNAKSSFVFFLVLFLFVSTIGGVISTESRGGFLNLIFSLGLVAFAHRHRFRPRFFGLLISFIGFVLILVITAIPDSYFQRQQTLVSGEEDVSLNRRQGYIKVGLKSFNEYPLLGTGTFTFHKVWVNSTETLRFRMKERACHNTYLEMLVGTGLVGLAVFLALLLQAFFDFTRSEAFFERIKKPEMVSAVAAYHIAFITVLIYCLIKSLQDHKLLLLILALAPACLNFTEQISTNQHINGE